MDNDTSNGTPLIFPRNGGPFHPYRRRQPFTSLDGGRNFASGPYYPPPGPSVSHWTRRGFYPYRHMRGGQRAAFNQQLINPCHLNFPGDEQNVYNLRRASNGSISSSVESPSGSTEDDGVCEDEEYVPEPVGTDRCVAVAVRTPGNPPLLPGCVEDEDSFLEMHVACVAPGLLNKESRAAYGIWFGRQSSLNCGNILPLNRPQTLKAVLIWASAEGIKLMKTKGFIRLKLIMESDFMIQNVSGWASKFMDAEVNEDEEKVAMCSNWDELKYVHEIWDLSKIFQGMLLKWTHVTSETHGIKCAKALARQALNCKPTPSQQFFILSIPNDLTNKNS